MNLLDAFGALFWVFAVASITPLLATWFKGFIPAVVLLLLGGILIGPQVFDLAETAPLELFSNLGLGFLFLLAGYELEPRLLREQPGRYAFVAWGLTVLLSLLVVEILYLEGEVRAFVPVTIALTTTALGTLLPILQEQGMLVGRFGRFMFAAGAVGELLPILAIALFLGVNQTWVQFLAIMAVGVAVWVLLMLPRAIKGNAIGRAFDMSQGATSQMTLRLSILLLLALFLLTERFDIDIVLGAFLAGMVLRQWGPGDVGELEHKLETVGHGVFIPIFFVYSGMTLDVEAIVDDPIRTVALAALLLLVRGVPAIFVYRRVLPWSERLQLVFLTATALPLLVAITEIATREGIMLKENAAALVGAGVISVALFPLAAILIRKRWPSDDLGDHGTDVSEPRTERRG